MPPSRRPRRSPVYLRLRKDWVAQRSDVEGQFRKSVRIAIGDVAFDVDVLAVVDDQGLGEILQ
jgi:hypothetical protein